MATSPRLTGTIASLLLAAVVGLCAEPGRGDQAALHRIPAPEGYTDTRVLFWGRWATVESLARLAAKYGDRAPQRGLPSLTAPDEAAGYGPYTRQSDSPGSACVLRFRGPRVRWLGGKGPNHGRADVYLDGKLVRTVDTYAPAAKAGQVLLDMAGLAPGAIHELRIVLTKDMDPKSTGRMQRVEGFEVAEVVDYVGGLRKAAAAEREAITAGKRPYLKPDQWKPVAYAACAPVSGVTLDGGPLRTCFDRNIVCLNEWYAKKNEYRVPEDPAAARKRKRIPQFGWEGYLPASSEGRMLGGAANTLRWGERKDMRAIVNTIVGIVKARQRDDGYCMPFPEEHMKPSSYAWHDERRNYDRVNLTRGLVAAALAGNPDAMGILRRFYDWLYASPYCSGLIAGPYGGSAHNCSNGHEGSLLMYFSPVGKPDDLVAAERYFVQDVCIEGARQADPLSLCYYSYHTPHCYVLLAYKAWLDHYRATGSAKYLEAAQGAWKIVCDHYLHVGGSLAICEAGGGSYPPGSYYLNHKGAVTAKYKGRAHTGETCGSVFWTDINHRLLQFFPDEAKYADQIEQEIFNVILAAQDAAGNIRYHNLLVDRKGPANFMNTCCEVMAQPFIARLPEVLYSLDDAGIYVNLYAPSTITWKHAGRDVTLTTATKFPFDGKVTLKVATGAPRKMKLRIRMPGWADRAVGVKVSGASAVKAEPGSYVVLDRMWTDGDTVSFGLPMTLRTVRYTGFDQDPDRERHALLFGPVLMALVGAEGDDLDIPAAQLPGRLKPVEGKPLHFAVDGKDGAYFMPYWQIDKESFTCFPTLR